MADPIKTTVGIVGAGPAGLMLSHLLARQGIDSVAIDSRTRHEIENTHRAGILEAHVTRMLTETGVDRVLKDGYEHHGIDLRFDGTSHRINFTDLVGESCWLYPQTDVFIDLANARERDGGDVRFGISSTEVDGITGDSPVIKFVDAQGQQQEIHCQIVAGCDGSRSITRFLIPEDKRVHYFKEYPFAWFGVMTESPMSAEELIYARSERGFALISQRTPTIQRLYMQCPVDEDVDAWTSEEIWDELQARVAGDDGFELKRGEIFERSLLRFRSFVAEPMRWGRLVLAGDAAHTVPPTGAKGLNLALNDVWILNEVLGRALKEKNLDLLDEYGPRALNRIWRSENFSYWMSQMLHTIPEANDFDAKRQVGELEMVTGSRAGQTYLAEAYTGWPHS